MTAQFLVTDTHPLLHFFCGNKNKLSKKALAAFESSVKSKSTSIYVPAPVLWEVLLLVEKGSISLSKSFPDWVSELFRYPAIIPTDFTAETVKLVYGLKYHKDPYDRAIVASALQLGLPLITNDGKMHEHLPCQIYWD